MMVITGMCTACNRKKASAGTQTAGIKISGTKFQWETIKHLSHYLCKDSLEGKGIFSEARENNFKQHSGGSSIQSLFLHVYV